MFHLDGRRSHECELASRLIEHSSLFDKFKGEIAVTVYRQTPEDSYWFITAMAGVIQHEPMYGPKTVKKGSLFKFSWREGIAGYKEYRYAYKDDEQPNSAVEPEMYRVYLSWRTKKNETEITQAFEKQLLPALRELLRESVRSRSSVSNPLYPDIWNVERRSRDEFRQRFRNLPPLPQPGQVLDMLSSVLRETLKKYTAQSDIEVIVYLPTVNSLTRQWSPGSGLTDVFPISIALPELPPGLMEKQKEDEVNVLTWAFHSARPLFFGRQPRHDDDPRILARPLSKFWRQMLRRGTPGSEPAKLLSMVESPDFRGLSVVPLPDLTESSSGGTADNSDPENSMGILLVHCKKSTGQSSYFPAHHFLVCRLARVLAGYLAPLLPLPGFPRWSEHVWRGGAVISNRDTFHRHSKTSSDEYAQVAPQFIESMMPEGAAVEVHALQPGYTAVVYKLNINDKHGILESSRIIKISRAEKTLKEYENYFRFIHNKSLGSLARIDVAQSLRMSSSAEPGKTAVSYGAVVYHFVEKAVSVEDAIADKKHTRKAVEAAILGIAEHMRDWWQPTSSSRVKAKELFLSKPFFSNPAWSRWNTENVANGNARRKLRSLHTALQKLNDTPCGNHPLFSTLMHGDLHFRNIFALSDSANRYALIDWGEVTDKGHALLDFSQMLVDAAYRVCWKKSGLNLKWIKEMLVNHCQYPEFVIDKATNRRAGVEECFFLALLHKMVKYYVMHLRATDPRDSFIITSTAAEQLWDDIQTLIRAIGSLAHRADGTARKQGLRPAEGFRDSGSKPRASATSGLSQRIRRKLQTDYPHMYSTIGLVKFGRFVDGSLTIRLPRPEKTDRRTPAYYKERVQPALLECAKALGVKNVNLEYY